eukprot:360117-Chlamydomonas_euryale.AAC.16
MADEGGRGRVRAMRAGEGDEGGCGREIACPLPLPPSKCKYAVPPLRTCAVHARGHNTGHNPGALNPKP